MDNQSGPSNRSELNVFPCYMPNEPCVEIILEWIRGAKKSIIVQAYRFNSQKIAMALIAAKQKGIDVKLLIDKQAESKAHNLIPHLRKYDINIQVDQKSEKFHNKVMIIDNEHVITGSYNWTDEKYYNDSDTIIFIKDPCVNKKFRDYYESLNLLYRNKAQIPRDIDKYLRNSPTSAKHTTNRFHPYRKSFRGNNTSQFSDEGISFRGNTSSCGVPLCQDSKSSINPADQGGFKVIVNKNEEKKRNSRNFVKVNVCFPRFNNQDCIELISSYIRDAKQSILIQACSLTHEKILNALLNSRRENINIKLLVDRKSFSDSEEKVSTLINAGINVKYDKNCYPGIAHNKTIIIDSHLVLTGSLNLTYSAQNSNQENLLHMENKYVNNMFKADFHKKWTKAEVINQPPDRKCVVS